MVAFTLLLIDHCLARMEKGPYDFTWRSYAISSHQRYNISVFIIVQSRENQNFNTFWLQGETKIHFAQMNKIKNPRLFWLPGQFKIQIFTLWKPSCSIPVMEIYCAYIFPEYTQRPRPSFPSMTTKSTDDAVQSCKLHLRSLISCFSLRTC